MIPNNAKISDIITELSDMQAINQKAELASVIGAPASATDNVVTQIAKIQGVKNTFATNLTAKGVPTVNSETLTAMSAKVGQIPIGNKVVSILVTPTDNNSVTVTGFNFVPRIFFASMATSTGTFFMQGSTDNSVKKKIFNGASGMATDNQVTISTNNGVLTVSNTFGYIAINVQYNFIIIE